jgi:4-hydroxy-tetrahydrodipicolinate synthase
MKGKYSGIYVAMVTPMTADENIDRGVLGRLTEDLIAAGVHGLIPLGSTGEYYALTPHERREVLQTVIETAAGRVPVVAGANAGSTRDVLEYSRQAEQLGASGLLLAAPYYSLPREEEIYEHFRAVNDAVGIPIMLYNYPGRVGVDLSPEFIERLAELKNVRYVKESTGDVTRVGEIIRRLGDRIAVFSGCDTEALEHFVLGAVGWVTGAANFLPQPTVELFEKAVTLQDYPAARGLFYRLLPMMNILEGAGKYTQYVKAGCALTGRSVGPPRRPLLPAKDSEIAEVRSALANLG